MSPKRFLSFVMFLVLCCLWAEHAFAQSGRQDTLSVKTDSVYYITDEIVVTGTRVNSKIIDVPYSISRISNTQFKFEKKLAINNVLGSVPGVFMQSRYGNHDVRISIRGFGSRSNSGIRGVRILLDGIPESEPDGQTRIEAIDFNAVGSIEIVKGNSSSLYTNAPGGVVNFINNIYFPASYATSFNDYSEFNLRRNGLKLGIRTSDYGFIATYTYHNYKGFRAHSEDYWHILNLVLETIPNDRSKLEILGYFTSGLIRLPGSLTKAEFDADPYQSAKREVDFDFRRISKKGRVGIRFNSFFGEGNSNEIEITTYGTIKYFERTQRDYRVMNRYGIGGSGRYVNRSTIFNRSNEFSVGSDIFYQAGPVEYYDNINGKKGDQLSAIIDEMTSNIGFYVQDYFELYNKQLYLLITGRYDNVLFDQKNNTLESQNDSRRFKSFTPKAALNYKFTPSIAAYTSYGISFDSPAGNELDNFPTSSSPGKLLNPDLKPQESNNFEIGIKGSVTNLNSKFFRNIFFEFAFFNILVNNEIVPFEVLGSVFYRNSAKTNRLGFEAGSDLELIQGLKLQLTYTFSQFTYKTYTALNIEQDSLQNFVEKQRNFSGNFVPSVPKHNLSASVLYEKMLLENLTAFTKVNFNFISGMFVNDANSDKTSGYNLLNFTAGLDYSIDKFNFILSGGVNNVFNKVYVGFININSTSGRFYEAGEPRSYFASLKAGYSF